MQNQTNTLMFKVTFKKNEKNWKEYHDKWNQLRAICKLAEDTSLAVGESATDIDTIKIVYDCTYAHILINVAEIMQTLRSFVMWQKGTWEVVRED